MSEPFPERSHPYYRCPSEVEDPLGNRPPNPLGNRSSPRCPSGVEDTTSGIFLLSSIFKYENKKKLEEHSIRARLVNPNHSLIKTFDLLYIVFSVFSLAGSMAIGFQWYIYMPGIFGSGLFLARWILWFSGRRVMADAEALMNGRGLIGSWVIKNEELEEYARNEVRRQSDEAVSGFFGLVFAGILASLINLIPLPVWGGALLGTGLGCFGLLVSRFHKRISSRQIKESDGSIYIGADGVLIGGVYHEWHTMGRNLDKVEYDEKTRSILCRITVRSRNGAQQRTIAIPVPHDRQHEVEGILRKFAEAYQNT